MDERRAPNRRQGCRGSGRPSDFSHSTTRSSRPMRIWSCTRAPSFPPALVLSLGSASSIYSNAGSLMSCHRIEHERHVARSSDHVPLTILPVLTGPLNPVFADLAEAYRITWLKTFGLLSVELATSVSRCPDTFPVRVTVRKLGPRVGQSPPMHRRTPRRIKASGRTFPATQTDAKTCP